MHNTQKLSPIGHDVVPLGVTFAFRILFASLIWSTSSKYLTRKFIWLEEIWKLETIKK